MYNTDKPTALVIMAAGIGSRFGRYKTVGKSRPKR